MALELRFNVRDDASAKVKNLNSELNQLKPSISGAENSMIGLNSSMTKMVGAATVVYAGLKSMQAGFDLTINRGFAFNKQLEEAKAGLTSLSVAVQNKSIPVMERYAKANIEASKTLSELQKINVETPHTLDQTNQIYKAMYVSMKNVGASTDDMVELTRSLSIAAGSAGIEFNSLLAGVDGLASGTVLANSDLGRFLSSLGLTNEKLKQSKDVVGLVKTSMEDFKAADTMSVALSNVENAWDSLAGAVTEDIFNDAKGYLNEFADLLNGAKDSLNTWGVELSTVDDVIMGGNIDNLKIKLAQMNSELIDAQMNQEKWYLNQTDLSKEVANRKWDILKLEEAISIVIANRPREVDVGKRPSRALTKEELEAIQKQLELSEKAREQYIAITGTQYDIWLQESSNKMRELAESGAFTNEELTKLWETLESSKDTEITISGLDKTYESMNDMLDLQMQLAEGALEWGSSFGSVNKGFDNIAKASKKMNLDAFRFEKADLKLQEDFAKSFLEANGDMLKEKEATEKFDSDTAALTQVRQTAEIGGYAALAGAMSTAFSEGSAGAQAFQAIQATLGIVNGFTAITGAWASAPFPANLPAVAATTAQMLPLIGQLGSLGGSGGGGGGGGGAFVTAGTVRDEKYYDNAKDTAEETNKPILAKFDRQIELLEQISGYGGTTIGLGLEKALAQYTADSTVAIIEASAKGTATLVDFNGRSWWQPFHDSLNSQTKSITDKLGVFSDNISTSQKFTWVEDYVNKYQSFSGVDETSFSGAAEFIDMLEYMKNNDLLETFGYTQLEYENIISDFQDVSSELAVTVLENINTLIDYSNDLEELFDTITNTTKYQTQNLQQAFSEVGSLAGETPISEYLQNQIDAIVELENSLTKEQISLLLSSDINDYVAQQTLIQDIQKDTLATLDAGVLEALNYKDSIMLVGEAMANSAENMKSFEDSFKTDFDLATDLATAVGMQLVPSFETLNKLFVELSESGGILTDAELEFLEANKALIEESQSLVDDAVANFTSNMESMADSIDGAIDTIKGGILSGDELTTDQIKRLNYTQMAFESALSSGDSDKARELIGEITSLSTGISSGAFGDTSKINQNLLSSLEANKAMIDFKDEILMVRIVASDLDYEQTVSTTTPSVYVTNSTNNDDRLATLEAIMIEVLKTNKNVYDVLLQIQNDGVKTI